VNTRKKDLGFDMSSVAIASLTISIIAESGRKRADSLP
jgi:hypothetical protein